MQLTPRCRTALNHAKEGLSRLGHERLSSAHLILGLLALGAGIPYNVLRQFGVSVQSVESYLSTRRSSAESTNLQQGEPFGASALEAFEGAKLEAQARDHTYLGTEHLFLGILAEEEGDAADLFASVHVDRGELRRIVVAAMSG